MAARVDFTEKTFNRWRVIAPAATRPNRQSYWLCECECGTQKEVSGYALHTGYSKSCGCFNREQTSKANTKHGHSSRDGHRTVLSPTYRSWATMLSRCRDPNVVRYPHYGGRGISVCSRWHDFRNFLEDMGERPKGMTLDRINNDGNYEPGNCRWAGDIEQARNKKNTRFLTLDGVTKPLVEWAEDVGIKTETMRQRLCYGWSTDRIIGQGVL